MTRLAWAAVAAGLGIWLGDVQGLPPLPLALFLGAAVALALLACSLPSRMGRALLGAALVGACLLLGALRISADPLDATLPDLARHEATVTLSGIVADDPEPAGAFLRLRLHAETVRTGGAGPVPVKGIVLVSLPIRSDVTYGDRLTLRGRLQPAGDDGFAGRLERGGVVGLMAFPRSVEVTPGLGNPLWATAYGVRRWLSHGLDRALPEPQAGLAKSLLLDQRRAVDPAVTDAFRASGTAHILAISGQHVALVLGMALPLAAWALGRRRGVYLLVPLAAVWVYTFVAGLPPSATRAALMGTVYLGALALGRPSAALPALAAATFGVLLVEPRALFSASLQLSVAAVAGMVALSEPAASRVHRWLTGGRPQDAVSPWVWSATRGLAAALGVSVAATAGTAPLLALLFGGVPLAGLPATLLALPPSGFAIGLGALAGSVGAAWPLLGGLAGWAAWLPLSLVIGVAEAFDGLPSLRAASGPWTVAFAIAWYAALVGVLLRVRPLRWPGRAWRAAREVGLFLLRLPLPRSRGALTALLVTVAGAAVLAWTAALAQPDGRLRVHILDVGQGSAALIVTPSGRQVLIDGGPDSRVTLAALGRVVPFYDRTLDAVALSHPQDDHAGGLAEVTRRYRVSAALDGPQDAGLPSYRNWRGAIDATGARRYVVTAGATIQVGDGVALEALWPGETLLAGTDADVNNNAVVWRVRYGRVSVLLPGDIGAPAERALVASGAGLHADALVLAHHGSRTSSTEAFLAAVAPASAAVSVGAGNRFGHPHVEALERAQRATAGPVLRTDVNGTVTYVTDGERLWTQATKR